jgi:FkbM family methyltransferase
MRSRTLQHWILPLTRSGRLPEAIWRRLPSPDLIRVPMPDGSGFDYYAGSYSSVGRELHWRGLEEVEAATLRPFIAIANGARLVVDVGANTGLYSLVACAAGARRVIAFEPVEESAARIRENAARNNFTGRMDVREEVVGDLSGLTRFHVPFGPTPSSASMNPEGFRHLPGRTVEKRVITLDEVLRDGPAVDVIKIDVEGFEDVVLRGARGVIERDMPVVFLECNVDGPADGVNALLKDLDYRSFHLLRGGPEPVPRIVPDPTERFRNFMASPIGARSR